MSTATEGLAAPRVRGHGFRRGFYRFRQSWLAMVGLAVVLGLLTIAVIGPDIAPYPQDLAGGVRTAARFQPPRAAFWFGTNELGQDMLSLVLAGTRISLLTGVVVVLLGAAFGTVVGSVAGFFGGWIDEVLMRVVDLVLTVPSLILAMAVATALGPGIGNMIIAITVSWWPGYARLVRGEVMAKKEETFVVAATAAGAGVARLLRRHILPNILSPIIVKMSLDMGFAILTVASLGFIGIGVRPPTPEWGSLLAVARANVTQYWWTAIFPGLAIFIAVFAFNLLGDGLRDLLDPRARR
jgi:peptide/nickel transport system permease protein